MSKRMRRWEDNHPIERPVVALCCGGCGRVFASREMGEGEFSGADHRAARWCCGHDDKPCSTEGCEGRAISCYTHCEACRERLTRERYLSLPAEPWDGESWVYSETKDAYYESPGHALDCAEDDATLESLRIVLCERPEPRFVDLHEWLGQDFDDPEAALDGLDIDEAQARVDALARAVSAQTWVPREVRLTARGGGA